MFDSLDSLWSKFIQIQKITTIFLNLYRIIMHDHCCHLCTFSDDCLDSDSVKYYFFTERLHNQSQPSWSLNARISWDSPGEGTYSLQSFLILIICCNHVIGRLVYMVDMTSAQKHVFRQVIAIFKRVSPDQ